MWNLINNWLRITYFLTASFRLGKEKFFLLELERVPILIPDHCKFIPNCFLAVKRWFNNLF